MCIYMQSPLPTDIRYKGRRISAEWRAQIGTNGFTIWVLDGRFGFYSLNDAKSYINGKTPKWGIINL